MRHTLCFGTACTPFVRTLSLASPRLSIQHRSPSTMSPMKQARCLGNVHEPVDAASDKQSKNPDIPEDPAEKRRGRPPLDYTTLFETPSSVSLDVIGVVRSPYQERFGTPRQPTITENTLGNKQQEASIHLNDKAKYQLSLRGLASFDYCWVVSFFHLNQGWNPLVTPPRGPRKRQGMFATRSPHRPNSIGLSCLRMTHVDEKQGIIHVLGIDLLDGTAVLDIKPYVPYCDAFPNARAGWLDDLEDKMDAPDRLNYYPPPAHLMRDTTPTPEQTQSPASNSQQIPKPHQTPEKADD